MYIDFQLRDATISRNCLFQYIKGIQCYESTMRWSHLPLYTLASPMTHNVYPWPVQCECGVQVGKFEHVQVVVTWDPHPVDRQTNMTENITLR